ncbi:MAG: hypothetical protein COW84_06700 [Gammaproteobacteria bacterium CG22_combo_CG10-13_8_21_14_all_40_8]|nr:MAG: hypothetical protein COW84_06700 [Gammaproteobacteria bacterium CG22_combo_CG10-13_8_21_14_all_40_8]
MSDSSDELWNFPCDFPIKVMGIAHEQLLIEVLLVIQKHAPGDYVPEVKPSKTGKFHSITVNFTAHSKQQLDAIYQELHALELVKVIL